MRCLLVGALLAGVGPAATGAAQNLVVNPDFDDALGRSSWIETGTWITDDWEADPASGALQITNAFPTSTVLLARQCVPVEAGRSYEIAGRVRVAPGQFGGARSTAISIAWWNATGCYTGSTVGSNALAGVASETGAWEAIGPTRVTAPPGAAGADVRLQVFKGDGGGAYAAAFDSISLPEPTGGLAGIVAIGALGLLPRARRPADAAPVRR